MPTISITHNNQKFFFVGSARNDYITDKIQDSGKFYESDLLLWLEKFPLQDGAIIDVGSNIGNHTIFFSKVLKRQVLSFEPYKEAYEQLKENVRLNNIDNVTLFDIGLGSKTTNASIDVPDAYNIGTAKTVSGDGDIDIKRLDDVVGDVETVALIKIDVEGNELDVLKGAKDTIRKHKPLMLVESQDLKEYKRNSDFLNKLGYKVVTIFGVTPMMILAHESHAIWNSTQATDQLLPEQFFKLNDQLTKAKQNYGELLKSKTAAKNDNTAEETTERETLLHTETEHLVVLNRYPSNDDLYSYTFVHSRIKAYAEKGLKVQVFVVADIEEEYEFEGIKVIKGNLDKLEEIITENKLKSILLHLLIPKVWDVVNRTRSSEKIFIWLHGAEIQNWKRRHFSYESQDKVIRAANRGYRLQHFWKKLLSTKDKKIKFIFVSKYLYDEVTADLDVTIAKDQTNIIYNYISSDIFRYSPKKAEDRYKVLFIRSFDSNLYPNKEAMEAIVRLSQNEHFDKFSFSIYGKGEHFKELTQEVKNFKNVKIHETFLPRDEIAAVQDQHGVFFVPTRTDTQGVSRDEAMASGLVPITTKVAAIPEFVDEKSAVLVNENSPDKLAKALLTLANDPDLFLRLSRSASENVVSTRSYENTLRKEIQLIKGSIDKVASRYKGTSYIAPYSELESKQAIAFGDLAKKHNDLQLANMRLSTELLGTQAKLKKKKRQLKKIKNGRSYKFGKRIFRPIYRWYHRRYIGLPLRIINSIVKGGLKPVFQGGKTRYKDINRNHNKSHFFLKNPDDISKLRIAGIMDEFTHTSYGRECKVKQLTPQNWLREIESFKPDLLFIESAWLGKNDLWRHKLGSVDREHVTQIVAYCKQHGIPTMFWNKEDPVHTSAFMPTASLCDFVFTTDINTLKIYQDVIGHDRIYPLPFAAQPKAINPIYEYEREDKVSFAGSYYKKYKHRSKNFDSLIHELSKVKDIVIYDRNSERNLSDHYAFPEEMQKYVRPSLPFSEIGKAYKGYEYAINMNSVQSSPTMFARRVFELLLSNTVVISNYSLGVKKFFGDLVITTNDGEKAASRLRKITANDTYLRAFKLKGLREVLNYHTYEHRLAYICNTIFDNVSYTVDSGDVAVVSYVGNQQEAEKVIQNFERQAYKNKKLILISDNPGDIATKYTVLKYEAVAQKKMNKIVSAAVTTYFKPTDYYGAHFVEDCVLAFTFSDAILHSGKTETAADEYTLGARIFYGALCSKTSALSTQTMHTYIRHGERHDEIASRTITVDRFSYRRDSDKPDADEAKAFKKIEKLKIGGYLHKLDKMSQLYKGNNTTRVLKKILYKLRIRKTYKPLKLSGGS